MLELFSPILIIFIVFCIVEFIAYSIISSVNKKFQWLIIDRNEFPKLSENGLKKFESKLEIMKKNFDVLEQRIVKSEYPVNVPKRYFLILQRK